MYRVFAGIVAIILTAGGAYLGWLLWPLPSNEFDWRSQFHAYAEDGDCPSAVSVAASVYGYWQDADALSFLRRIRANEWCEDGEALVLSDTIIRFESEPPIEFLSPQTEAILLQHSDEAFWRWMRIRMTRQRAFGTPISLTDLSSIFRCHWLTYNAYELEWRAVRNALSATLDNQLRLVAWDRRENECRARIASELERLGPLNEGISDAHFSLIIEYQDLVELIIE